MWKWRKQKAEIESAGCPDWTKSAGRWQRHWQRSHQKQMNTDKKKTKHLTSTLSPERRGGEAPCVTRFELASLLQVSLRTVDRMIAAEEINVHRVRGKAVRFLRSDVEEYLQNKT